MIRLIPRATLVSLLASLLLLLLLVTGCAGTTLTATPSSTPPTPPSTTAEPPPTTDPATDPTANLAPTRDRLVIPGEATMIRAVDGDTIAVDPKGPGTEDRIRVLGINTPERGKCAFREATRYVTDNIPAGTRVLLVPDEAQDDTDRYGRFLRYVRIPQPDGAPDLDLSIASAEAGWAEYYDRYPVSLSPEIRAAEARAQTAGLGRWGLCQA